MAFGNVSSTARAEQNMAMDLSYLFEVVRTTILWFSGLRWVVGDGEYIAETSGKRREEEDFTRSPEDGGAMIGRSRVSRLVATLVGPVIGA